MRDCMGECLLIFDIGRWFTGYATYADWVLPSLVQWAHSEESVLLRNTTILFSRLQFVGEILPKLFRRGHRPCGYCSGRFLDSDLRLTRSVVDATYCVQRFHFGGINFDICLTIQDEVSDSMLDYHLRVEVVRLLPVNAEPCSVSAESAHSQIRSAPTQMRTEEIAELLAFLSRDDLETCELTAKLLRRIITDHSLGYARRLIFRATTVPHKTTNAIVCFCTRALSAGSTMSVSHRTITMSFPCDDDGCAVLCRSYIKLLKVHDNRFMQSLACSDLSDAHFENVVEYGKK